MLVEQHGVTLLREEAALSLIGAAHLSGDAVGRHVEDFLDISQLVLVFLSSDDAAKHTAVRTKGHLEGHGSNVASVHVVYQYAPVDEVGLDIGDVQVAAVKILHTVRIGFSGHDVYEHALVPDRHLLLPLAVEGPPPLYALWW